MVSAAPPAKILDYKRDLSSLRYRGQWQTVIQLAEKYLGKLGENRSADYAFGLICKGEGLLNQIHQDYLRRDFPADDGVRRRHWYPVDFPQPTAPDPSPDDSIVIEDMDDERQSTTGSNLSPEEHERSAVALKYLTQAVAILQGEDSYSRQLFLEASTILCFHDGIIGQTEQMANRIRDPRWQWNLDNPPPDLADSAHPYEHVLRLMFWTAHALGSQAEKEEDTSLLYINRAVEYYRQHKVLVCPKLSRTRPTHGSDEDQWLRWAEFSHFWSTLHNARLGNSEQSIAVARDYVKMMGSSSNDHRTQPRIAVVGTLMRQLAGVPIVGEIPVPFRGIATQSPPTLAPEIRKELLRLAVTYEALTTHLLDFPRGEDQLPMEKNRHARVVECYDWYVWLMTQPVPGENVGQACDRYIDLLKHLYRGTKHTFHNMRLFRYLCHTLTRLMLLNHDNMSLGERIEAEAVMESYKFFWIKHFDSKLASEKKKKAESVGSIPSSPRRLSTVRSMKRRDANGNTITMDVPYDPVFDKDGNYIRLKDLDAYLEKLTKEEDDKIMKALQMTTIPDDNLVVIGEVDGERIEDAIGVFLSAVKVFTLTADGEVAKLEVAYDYAKLALGLIEEHGRALLNPTTYRFEAYKITAEVCLELEQEVREVGARTQWQVRAADAIRKCLVEQPKSPEVLYLKALLAAQRGECESATLIVRASLHENKDRATSWNLMALLCSAHKEYDQAIQFCRAGAIKSYEYLEQLLAAGDVSDAHIDAEKFDLINLKLTDASLRLQKEGPEGGLEVIREVITLARKLFPGVDGGRSTDEIIAGPSRSTTPTPSIATGRTGSSIGASPYIAPYRFGIHDLFVGIWLATSSLYRLAGMLDKAKNAVQEAETLAEEVIRMDSLIEGTPSRFYSGISMDKLLERQSGIQRDMRLGKIKTAMRVGESDKFDSFPTWGPARARVRRVIADVAFEV
ncbi:hypothetical protein DFS34DRAFT_617824 [Phlyctochytrium arcticum]|nr:hypothetical protein DFS34DRAFT_617824 [Phlyctochytrium arcticum]